MSSTETTLNQPHLSKQDLSTLDISKLTPLSPEVISRQATINIGTIGHVAHGKSTVVKAISGVQTVRFKNELERNITIKLARLPLETITALTNSRSNVRAFIRDEEKRRVSRLKSHRCERILDFRYRRGHIQCQVVWRTKEKDTNGSINESLPVWDSYEELKGNESFMRILGAQTAESKLKDTILDIKFPEDEHLTRKALEPKRFKEILEKELPKFDKFEFHCYCTLYARALDIGYVGPNFLDVFMEKRTLALYVRQREHMQNQLATLSARLTEAAGVSVTFENKIDFDVPTPFNYISKCFSNDVVIPDDPIIGCDCRSCNVNRECCPNLSGSTSFAYNREKRLILSQGKAIYECNSRCKCDSRCPNRVVQYGPTVPFTVFKTPDRGWGLKTTTDLAKGQFICEYVGEVVDYAKAEQLGQTYDNVGQTYLFDLDYNNSERPYTVDAFAYGNISRFMNHSCDPNCAIWAVYINCLDPNLPSLGIFTKNAVAAGGELTFDYNAGSGSSEGDDGTRGTQIGKCYCKARKCRSYLFEA